MKIRAQALTVRAFAPFGQVIELDQGDPLFINEGYTEKYANLAELSSLQGSLFSIHRYRSSAALQPVAITKLERHVLGHQAFVPLHARPFPIVVAAAGPPPIAEQLRVFLSNGRQGINLAPGTWHHYQISLEDGCEYLVIERDGAEQDCEEIELPEPVTLSLYDA